MQRYLLERLLERIACSPRRDCVIIKGGMLISSLIGVDKRSTKDLDATVRG
ncbi:nucleotidyl transferase AbiEii/AbiGii toxin family protein [Olsenella intestinalis]|uniref:nucleotidyl transferase AbiEii/AbiGii toxin family protein n=1 Tax=Olsenella intestinalis TaxID=2930083 RepID=UPI003D1619DE